MSRKKRDYSRKALPDPKFGQVIVTRFVNAMMEHGKRGLSESIFYGALDDIQAKTSREPVEVFGEALENVRPMVEVRSRRVGGATYQVPMEVSSDRRTTLAIRWILGAARDRSGKSFSDKLASELIDAFNETGSAIRKRDETHKMAEANRAFSHYRI